MQALELRDTPLQWETERQNRILQSALEHKRQAGKDGGQNVAAGSRPAQREVSVTPEEWTEKLHRIPEMRSALIPFGDEAGAEEWSKPFSLAKADMEPWLSFYKGYKQSRLFIEGLPAPGVSDADRWPAPDYAVRALLDLKKLPPKLLAEPPVQINRQVEYFDLEGELKINSDPARVRALLISAANVHDAELRRAVEKGRDMGNQLHDALLGEGHGNLISAWVKVFKRKPTVEELHFMLSTGRVKVSSERREASPAPATAARPRDVAPRMEAETKSPAPVQRAELQSPRPATARVEAAAIAKMVADAEPDDDGDDQPVQISSGMSKRKIAWHLVQAVACCAALAGVFVYF